MKRVKQPDSDNAVVIRNSGEAIVRTDYGLLTFKTGIKLPKGVIAMATNSISPLKQQGKEASHR
jgi:hypothetical protein